MILFLLIVFASLLSFLIVFFTHIHWLFAIPIFIGGIALGVLLFLLWCQIAALIVNGKNKEILKPKKALTAVTRYGCHFVKTIMRIKIIPIGLDKIKDEPFLLVSNHQSLLDPLMIISSFKEMGLTFIMKDSILKMPVIGDYLKASGHLSINRSNNRQGLETIIKAIKRIENGFPIGVFPEGTRSHNGSLGDFHDGSFKIALRAKCPIVICIVENGYKVKKNFPFHRTKFYVKVCDVLEYDSFKDMSTLEISQIVYEKMKNGLEEIRNK